MDAPNMKIKNTVNSWVKKMMKKKVGSLIKRKNFVIKKIGPNEYDIGYYVISSYGNPFIANFRSGDSATLAKVLYDIEMKIVEWRDGVPTYINQM